MWQICCAHTFSPLICQHFVKVGIFLFFYVLHTLCNGWFYCQATSRWPYICVWFNHGFIEVIIVITTYFPLMYIISHRALLFPLIWAYLRGVTLKTNSEYHIIFHLMAQNWFTILQKSYFSCSIAWLIAEVHKEWDQDIKFYIWLSFIDGLFPTTCALLLNYLFISSELIHLISVVAVTTGSFMCLIKGGVVLPNTKFPLFP